MSLKLLNKGNKVAEIFIYGDIGDSWFSDSITAKDFAQQVQKLGDIDTIYLNINSPGGVVWDGLAIHNVLTRHKAKVIVNIDGLAASIASIVAMSGDEINMAANAFMMIHNPWTFTSGFSDDLRKTAEQLDLVAEELLNTYCHQCGDKTSKDTLKAFMDEEKWFNADEALAVGLVDSVTAEQQMAASMNFDMSRYKYKNTPKFIPAAHSKPSDIERRARIAKMEMYVTKNASASRQSQKL